MLLDYDKYSTFKLATILEEAHNGVFGEKKRMFGAAREVVIAELDRCLSIARLKEIKQTVDPKSFL